MERVVLLSDDGAPVGVMAKADVHTTDTPLHLAFSCYIVRPDGALLVTRRALGKQAWPGVWTNSFCGHPSPGEHIEEAVRRRALQELGAQVSNIKLRIPDFRYRATDASGVVENEVCPVFTAYLNGGLEPDPAEITEWAWVDRAALETAVSSAPFAFSPWMVLQLVRLPVFDTPGPLEMDFVEENCGL